MEACNTFLLCRVGVMIVKSNLAKLFFIVTALSPCSVRSCGLVCCVCWHALRVFSLCVCAFEPFLAGPFTWVSVMVHRVLEWRKRVSAVTVCWTPCRHSELQSPSIRWF